MKRGGKMAICLAGGLAFVPTVPGAISDQNPYKAIVARNAFALVPRPIDNPGPVEPPKPPPNVKLTGITKLSGIVRALLMVTPVGGPAKDPLYLSLKVGQQDGDVQVMAIDDKHGQVSIKMNGQLSTLDFDKDGIKVASMPAPPIPGVLTRPGLPAVPIPPPRPPERPVRGEKVEIPKMTPEVQTIAIEVERERLKQAGDDSAKLLPTTELTPDNSPDSGAEPAAPSQ
jgi:hypothetical protein